MKSSSKNDEKIDFLTETVLKIKASYEEASNFSLSKVKIDLEILDKKLKETKDELNSVQTKLFTEYTHRAFEFFINNKFDEAINYCNRSIEIFNTDWLQVFLGNIFIIKKNYKIAKHHFENAIEMDSNPYTLLSMGNIYSMLSEYDNSLKYYYKGLGGNLDATIYYNIAVTFAKKGSREKSIENYNKSININPKNIPALFNVANLYFNLGKFDKAEMFYKRVFNLNYNLFGINKDYIYGLLYVGKGDSIKAIEEYKKSTINRPMDYRAFINLSNLYLARKQYDLSINILNKAPQKDYRYYAILGINQFHKKEFSSAIINLEISLKLQNKEVPNVIEKLSTSYRLVGNIERSKAIIETAINEGYTDYELLMNIALEYEKERNCEKAQKYYLLATKHHSIENAYINLLRVLIQCSSEKTKEYFEKGIALFPKSSELYNNMGVYLLQNKKFEEAKQYFEKAMLFGPKNKNAINNYNIVSKDLKAN